MTRVSLSRAVSPPPAQSFSSPGRVSVRRRVLACGASALIAAAALAGCAVGPNYRTPTVRVPDHYDALSQMPQGHASRAPASPVDLASWWRTLGDPELDSLIERAVTGNPSVLIALDRLQAARLYEAGLTGTILPAAAASGGRGWGTGQDATRGLIDEPLHAADNTHDVTQVNTVGGFDAVWEIDIFGRVRREMEQARYNAQAAADARNAVLVSVVADVARAYVDLRGAQQRTAVLHSAAAALQQGVNIATERYNRGISNELDVTLEQRELSTIESEIPIVNAEVSAGEYAIATLLGVYPESLTRELSSPEMIPSVPGSVSPGLPLDLLRRRPDVAEAERQIASANAGIGIATAELFPEVVATGALGAQRATLGAATVGQHLWSAGAGVMWPLLDFGVLDARVQIANYQTRAALESYKATIENAVQQVDTSIARFSAAQQSVGSLNDAVTASKRAVTLATARYNRGIIDYLNVVDAQREEYAIEEQFVMTQVSADDQYVELYRNLGGGWQGFQKVPPIPHPLPALLAIFKDTIARSNPLKDPGPTPGSGK